MKMRLEKITPKGQEKYPEGETQDVLRRAMEASAAGHLSQDPLTHARSELILPGNQRALAQKGVAMRGSLSKERIEIISEVRKSLDPQKIEQTMRVIIWRAANGSSGIKLTRGTMELVTVAEYPLPTTLVKAREAVNATIREALMS